MRNLLFAMAAVAMVTVSASANSVNISTGVADWTVNQAPAVVISPTHPAWNTTLVAAGAKWIGVNNVNYGTVPDGTYVYSTALNLDPGVYELDAKFSSDNAITKIMLGNVTLFEASVVNGGEGLAIPNNVYSFKYIFAVSGAANSPSALEFTVFNGLPQGTPADNPSGLIVAGTVTAVPVPAAAWAGMALLGGLGAIRAIRRRVA